MAAASESASKCRGSVAKRGDAGNGAEAPRVGGAAGLEHRARVIDHRPGGFRDHRAGGFQALPAHIGVADAVEDEIVRRQRRPAVVILRHQHRGCEFAVVENGAGRNIAADRGHEQQDRNRAAGTAVWQRRQRIAGEGPVAMPTGAGGIAELGQKIGHAAVRVNVEWIKAQGGREMAPRFVVFFEVEQKVGEIDVPHRIVGMVPHRLAE
jgi:hypothetical protein